MKPYLKWTLLVLLLAAWSQAYSQYTGPRYFWDIPSIYATSLDALNFTDRVGLGAETTFNIASYWGTSRLGGGSTFTINPNAADVTDSFLAIPYFLVEGGAGMYRTNGNKCSVTNANAFTAMPVIGIRYDLQSKALVAASENDLYGFKWGIGAELGWFLIRDVVRNTELVLRGTYYPQIDQLSLNFGFKFFLNMRELGRY